MNPYHVEGPAVISFSGGRTSAYMLFHILEAYGGRLPESVVPIFSNTGREMPATLDFVRDCERHWGVKVVWVEFTARNKTGYKVVTHETASRDGAPFAALLTAQSALPNPVQRSCTQELKIRTMKRFVVGELGWTRWTNVVGLRYDEQRRVLRTKKPTKERWTTATPLNDARVTSKDVSDFWAIETFDLGLKGKWEGNCDGCFLKSKAATLRVIRDHPERMRWWAEMEAVPRGTAGVTRFFRKDRPPYVDLYKIAWNRESLMPDETMVEGGEACGVYCGV